MVRAAPRSQDRAHKRPRVKGRFVKQETGPHGLMGGPGHAMAVGTGLGPQAHGLLEGMDEDEQVREGLERV